MSDINNIKNWSDAELKEDDNDPDDLSAAKFNERRWRARAKKEEEDQKKAEAKRKVEVAATAKQRAQAEEAAKKRVSELFIPPIVC